YDASLGSTTQSSSFVLSPGIIAGIAIASAAIVAALVAVTVMLLRTRRTNKGASDNHQLGIAGGAEGRISHTASTEHLTAQQGPIPLGTPHPHLPEPFQQQQEQQQPLPSQNQQFFSLPHRLSQQDLASSYALPAAPSAQGYYTMQDPMQYQQVPVELQPYQTLVPELPQGAWVPHTPLSPPLPPVLPAQLPVSPQPLQPLYLQQQQQQQNQLQNYRISYSPPNHPVRSPALVNGILPVGPDSPSKASAARWAAAGLHTGAGSVSPTSPGSLLPPPALSPQPPPLPGSRRYSPTSPLSPHPLSPAAWLPSATAATVASPLPPPVPQLPTSFATQPPQRPFRYPPLAPESSATLPLPPPLHQPPQQQDLVAAPAIAATSPRPSPRAPPRSDSRHVDVDRARLAVDTFAAAGGTWR
ncbi:hypothetical protein HK405_013458, partial [Cladochytrium tenue]